MGREPEYISQFLPIYLSGNMTPGLSLQRYLEKGSGRRRSDVFIINSEQIPHLVLVFMLLTLNK